MADYKQLCVELLSELENAIGVIYGEDGTRHISSADAVITKADAALAKPGPESPTNEELYGLMYEFTIGTGHGERLDEIGFARAVLARWGNQSPSAPPQ